MGAKAAQGAVLHLAEFRTETRLSAILPAGQCPAIASGRNELGGTSGGEAELGQALSWARRELERKDRRIQQKELLRRESDHRLLNGLQMVASLLSTQSRLTTDSRAAAQLSSAADRVIRIGSVHRRLHELDHLESVELKRHLENLCRDMADMLPVAGPKIALAVEGIALTVPTAIGVPLGFIVSELVTNSVKYACGKITVRLGADPVMGYALSVSDEGPGLPEGFNPAASKGLGTRIVSSLVKQIGGRLGWGRGSLGRGACFTVYFSNPGGLAREGTSPSLDGDYRPRPSSR